MDDFRDFPQTSPWIPNFKLPDLPLRKKDSKTGCNRIYIWKTNLIGLLIPGVRGLTSSDNPWVHLAKNGFFRRMAPFFGDGKKIRTIASGFYPMGGR